MNRARLLALTAKAMILAAARLAAPAPARAAASPAAATQTLAPADSGSDAALRFSIEHNLGRPYVWGSCGLKSFDCSGFVWRVMLENRVLMKRTTARKLYMVLPKVKESDRWAFGNVVFFSNRKHCGIVDTRDTFYHAQTSKGTNLSRFDPLWRGRICGVRALPRAAVRDTSNTD